MKTRCLSYLPLFLLLTCTGSLSLAQSVKINEVQVRPPTDGLSAQYQSMFNCPNPTWGAEWVELYNPDPCSAMDLTGYILGAQTIATNYGAVMLPAGTTIPPLGFLVLGGPNAPSVDLNLTSLCGTANICTDGDSRWYMENGDGWVALYRPNATVADAVFWTFSAGQSSKLTTDSDFASAPCTPSGSAAGALPAASTMGAVIGYAGVGPTMNQTVFRSTDGGGTWASNGTPTPKACNATCSSLTCGPLAQQQLIFEGLSLGHDNYVYWMQQEVSGIHTYELERWQDGQAFEIVAVRTAGSAVDGHYSYTGPRPDADYEYYRLSCRDAEGRLVHQSPVIRLAGVPGGGTDARLSPIPARDYVDLEAWLDTETTSEWSLWDLSGRQVMHLEFPAQSGRLAVRIPLENLPQGLYAWQFRAQGRQLSGKLLH